MVATPQKKSGAPRAGPVVEQSSPNADRDGGKTRTKPSTPAKDDGMTSSVQSTPIKSPAMKKTKVNSPIACPVPEVVDNSLGRESSTATPMEVESALGSAADLQDPRLTPQFSKNSWGPLYPIYIYIYISIYIYIYTYI